jgi:MFS family permease
MARVAFTDVRLRRHALWIVVTLIIFIGMISLVEFRFRPYFYSRLLEQLGVVQAHNTMVLGRSGFFRAQAGMVHPIDLGNVAVLAACLIALLAGTSGTRLRDKRIVIALLACVGIVIASISFTSLTMLVAAGLTYALLRAQPSLRWLLVPGIVAAVIAAVVVTGMLLNLDYTRTHGDEAIRSSFLVRIEIIQKSWRFAERAGLFGFSDTISKRELNLDSVDNSYMLFVMRRGWAYLTLWIALMVSIGWVGFRMLSAKLEQRTLAPVVAALAGLLSTFVAMYTVWFGFVYANLWLILLGFTATMSQVLAGKVVLTQQTKTRAMPVLPYGPMPDRMPVTAG